MRMQDPVGVGNCCAIAADATILATTCELLWLEGLKAAYHVVACSFIQVLYLAKTIQHALQRLAMAYILTRGLLEAHRSYNSRYKNPNFCL